MKLKIFLTIIFYLSFAEVQCDLAELVIPTFPYINSFLAGFDMGVKQADNITVNGECFGQQAEKDVKTIAEAVDKGNYMVTYVASLSALDNIFRDCNLNE